MKNPKILYIRVSENCNSNCFMCHYAGKKDSYNITIDEYEKVLEYAIKSKIKMIRFTGGEPLIHPDIIEFLKRARDLQLDTSIITNGFLLKIKYQDLIESGLKECIISLDGSCAKIHDELRNFKGCFNNIMSGIKLLKQNDSDMIVRINTVVSGRNIHDLINIYHLLIDLKINQWSIIPLKSKDNIWTRDSKKYYIDFLREVENNDDNQLLFLGYSKMFAGSTDQEIDDLIIYNKKMVSKNECQVIDFVRFYIPDKKLLVPCNCISHRLNTIPVDLNNGMEENCEKLREWLKRHSQECIGCEPLNVYINDHPEIMDIKPIQY